MSILKEIPIGIYEKALPTSIGWEERLSAAAKAGYDFVEISIDESDQRLARLNWNKKERDELRQAVLATGVKIPTMCLSGHRKYPLGSEDVEIRRQALDIMEKAINFAVDTGIRIVQVAGYDVFYEKSNEKTRGNFLDGLRRSVAWAEKAGVMLAIETMDYEFMNSVEKTMAFVKLINSPWLQVYPDIGNLSAWGQDINKEFEAGRGHIVAVHVKDTVPGEFRRVPFGQGKVPFAAAFRKLASMDYKGPVLVEMWNDDAADSINIIAEARRYISNQMLNGWSQVSQGV
ncbi:MAG: xylulose 5-phosphate 3-epimerase [Firmicutes bacterium]|nr:xylulose 5-phosphate 3-epimerase [Bacillota bacterium]